MRRPVLRHLVIAGLVAAALSGCGRDKPSKTDLNVAAVGKVTLYRHTSRAKHLVFLLSGADGADVQDRAWALAWPDRVVAVIDGTHLPSQQGDQCVDYAGALAAVRAAITSTLKTPLDSEQFLSGIGVGAAEAYAAAVQEPGHHVQGVLAESFCPELPSEKPPCPGSGSLQSQKRDQSFALLPSAALTSPLVVIGRADACKDDLQTFVKALPDGRLVAPVADRAIDLFASVAAQTMAKASAGRSGGTNLQGIPVVEVPATGKDDRLAVILSGDGGWADIDKDIGERLAKQGIAVIGFDSLKYFWDRKTPEQAAADLDRVIRHYVETTGRKRLVLAGYSFGADVLPLLFPLLSDETRKQTVLLALLATGSKSALEIAVGAWVGIDTSEGPDLAPELKALDVPVLCVHSAEATDDACARVANPQIEVMTLAGDHHFNHDYAPIATRILDKSATPVK
jgi:type IV secretory pathway VirJ component